MTNPQNGVEEKYKSGYPFFQTILREGEMIDYIPEDIDINYDVSIHLLNKWKGKSKDGGDYYKAPQCRIRLPKKEPTKQSSIIEYIEEQETEFKKKKLAKQYEASEAVDTLAVQIEKRENLLKLKKDKMDEYLKGRDINDLPEDERKFVEDIRDKIDFEISKFELG